MLSIVDDRLNLEQEVLLFTFFNFAPSLVLLFSITKPDVSLALTFKTD
jgi:hypothetical protein